MDLESINAILNSGGAIGGGAVTGAVVLVTFFKSHMKKIEDTLAAVQKTLQKIEVDLAASHSKYDTEIEFIKIKIKEIEVRLDRLEDKE